MACRCTIRDQRLHCAWVFAKLRWYWQTLVAWAALFAVVCVSVTSPIKTDYRSNLIGSFWMVTAMAAFAIEDGLVKAASGTVPVGQILVVFGLGGAMVFAAVARLNGEPLYSAAVISPPMQVRVLFEIFGRLFYLLAITLSPLSTATVILQATPIVVVAGAAVVFREPVGWQRWFAILVGLSGVLIILAPGSSGFSLLSVFAVLGMLGFAGRDLASRAAPASLSTSILGLYGFLSVFCAGCIYSLWQPQPFVWPGAASAVLLSGAVLAGVAAYACLMKAMRTGEVSAVTPFRYSRLLFGVAFGVLVFGEQLTASMITGCSLIVLSGLFILWRGKQKMMPQ